MINLAFKEIRFNLSKFIITAIGVGTLLGIVLIMVGVYRGMIIDAQSLLRDIDGDIWVVQENTLGPFAQPSILHEDLKDKILAIEGVKDVLPLSVESMQLKTKQGLNKVVAIGYDIYSNFHFIKPLRGREILKSHFELVADSKLHLDLNETIKIGRDEYKVVGIVKNGVSSGGEPLIYLSLQDAQRVQFSFSNNRIRKELLRGKKDFDTHFINAVVVRVKKGFSCKKVANAIKNQLRVNVFLNEEEKNILTKNLIKMASKQIGMFTIILIIVSTIIIALIIYTMTLEKQKEIAILKLIGIDKKEIIKMIVQETLILGILAFCFALLFSHLIYDKFPKRVVLQNYDAIALFIIVLIASFFASLAAIKKVLSTKAQSALA